MASSSDGVRQFPVPETFARFNDMRRSRKLCDVVLTSREHRTSDDEKYRFHVHKLVLLAASPHFEEIFAAGMREARENVVDMDTDYTTLKRLVRYMYTGRIVINSTTVPLLLPEAAYLQLTSLKSACEKYLITVKYVTRLNCIEMWNFSKLYDCEEIKALSWQFIREYFGTLVASEDLPTLSHEDFSRLVEDMGINCSETALFEAVMTWVRGHNDDENRGERKKHLAQLLSHVRLTGLGRSCLLDTVYHETLVREDEQCNEMLVAAMHTLLRDTLKHTQPVLRGNGMPLEWTQKKWTRLCDLLHDRYDHCSAELDGLLYSVGGYGENAYTAEVLNPITGECKLIAAMGSRRQNSAMCAVLSPGSHRGSCTSCTEASWKLYVIGGYDGPSSICYDPVTDKWSNGGVSYNSARHAAVSHENTVYVFGGYSTSSPLRTAFRFDIRDGMMQNLPDLVNCSGRVSACELNGDMAVVERLCRSKPVEIFDVRGNRWTTGPTLPIDGDVSYVSIASHAGRLLIAGGYGDNKSVHMSVGGEWTSLADLEHAGDHIGLLATDKAIYTLGGYGRGKVVEALWIDPPY